MVQIKNVLFGKLAVSTRFITEEQLQECLDYQKEVEERGERPPRLGEILEQKGYLTKQQIQSILETMSSMQRRRFGEIAVAFHFITLEQLETCLDIQKLLQAPQETVPLFGQALVTYRGFLKQVLAGGAHPKIGDVLVAMGYMRNHQVEAVLEEQNKRIVRCKSCEASLNISRFEPGQKIKCGQCNAVLEIVKPEGSEELDVALPTETVSAPAPGAEGVPPEEQPLDPATAMMELDKEIARVRATQQFSPAKVQKTPGRIADFQVVTRLGQDATGVIFKASQISKNRPVALKIMNPSVMNDPNFQKKFIDDAKKVAGLEHPNIKRVYSLGKSDNRFYIAMEFVEAESVYNVLEKQGKFHFETAIGIAISIGEALQYAQQQGLIHGDVRPSNVLLLRDGTVKVANLGLATKVSENILAISRSGQMAPFYIAPECVTGDREMDQRTDIYSLGATLFHMVAGRPPFQGQSPFEVLVRLTEETIPPLKFFDPSIPDSVCRVVEKMLEAEPQDRYQTWEELLGEFRAIQAAAGGAPAPAAAAAGPGSGMLPGPAAAVRTADDAKRTYEAKVSRAAQMRAARRGILAVAIVVAIVGGGLFAMNKMAENARAEEWASLRARYRNDPVQSEDFRQRRENFRRFASLYPGSPESEDALQQVVLLEKMEVVARDKELQSLRDEVRKNLGENQFKAALDSLGHGSFWKREDPELQKLVPEINAAADRDWDAVREKALGMAREDQIQASKAFVDEATRRRGWPSDGDAAKKLVGEIDEIRRENLAKRAAEEEDARRKKSREVLDAGLKDVQEMMKKFLFQQAVQKLGILKSQVHADHLAEVMEWTERVQWSWDLLTNAVAAVNDKAAEFGRTHDVNSDKRAVHVMSNKLEGRAIGASASAVTFQDPKQTMTEPIAWADLDPAVMLYILAQAIQQAGLTNESHFAFGDCASLRSETITDMPTRVRLMTVAEREYKAAADTGMARRAAPRQEAVAKFFGDAKRQSIDAAKAAVDARRPAEARASLRTLVNQFWGRLGDVMADVHAVFAASFDTSGAGQYLSFAGGAPAALKPTQGWTAADGVLTGSGKDETLEFEGGVSEACLVFRMPDDRFILTFELGGAKVTYKPNANNGEGSIEVDVMKVDEDGSVKLDKRLKCQKLPTLASRTWHVLEIRQVQAGGATSLEIVVNGTPVTPRSLAVALPLKGLVLRLNGLSINKEGRVDILGIYTQGK